MVDIIILVCLVASLYMGYKRGLVAQLFYLATIVIGYVVAMLFSSRFAYLFANFIPIPKDLTTGLEGIYKGLNIPEAYYRIISFIVIFLLIKIVIQVIASLLGIITKLPLIKTTDRFLGAILGFVEVYLVIFVVLYFLTVLPVADWKTMVFKDATLPSLILEQTPILSKNLIQLFFNYVK